MTDLSHLISSLRIATVPDESSLMIALFLIILALCANLSVLNVSE